jgi:large subunit ribosomal protein L15
MNLSNLKPPAGSRRPNKRRGRGESSGLGKTAGRGHKGMGSRKGNGKISAGFEGGQTPLIRRLPKFGFTNVFRKERAVVNLSDLEKFDAGAVVDYAALHSKGLVPKNSEGGVKVLGKGELKKALTVKAGAFSKTASDKIQKAGGTAEVVK